MDILKAAGLCFFLGIMCAGCAVDTVISVQNRSDEAFIVKDGATGKTIKLAPWKTAKFGGMVELSIHDEHGGKWAYTQINIHQKELYPFWVQRAFTMSLTGEVQLRLAILKGRSIYVLTPDSGKAKLEMESQPLGFPMRPKKQG